VIKKPQYRGGQGPIWVVDPLDEWMDGLMDKKELSRKFTARLLPSVCNRRSLRSVGERVAAYTAKGFTAESLKEKQGFRNQECLCHNCGIYK
jgi:hypothetical protein